MDEFTVGGHELIRKTATEHGNSAHVYVPKDWLGANLAVIRTSDIKTKEGEEENEVATLVGDPFESPLSPPILTFGDNDSGKNRSITNRALRWEENREDRTVIFLELGDYCANAVKNVNGMRLFIGTGQVINPLDIRKPPESATSDPEVDTFRTKINQAALFILSEYLFQKSDGDGNLPLIKKILRQTYREKGITADPKTHDKESPTMSDFIETAVAMLDDIGTEDASDNTYTRLGKEKRSDEISELMTGIRGYSDSGGRRMFNGQTEIHIPSGEATYIDVADFWGMAGDELTSIMLAILSHLENFAQTTPGETLVVMDNSHQLFRTPQIAHEVQAFTRRLQRYETCLWFVSNSPEEFIAEDASENPPHMVRQSQSVEFFRSKIGERVQANFNLNDDQVEFITGADVIGSDSELIGEGLARRSDSLGYSRFAVRPSPIEENVLTKENPDEGSGSGDTNSN